jgi:hypothetical protein
MHTQTHTHTHAHTHTRTHEHTHTHTLTLTYTGNNWPVMPAEEEGKRQCPHWGKFFLQTIKKNFRREKTLVSRLGEVQISIVLQDILAAYIYMYAS